jgi:hypothetical protein
MSDKETTDIMTNLSMLIVILDMINCSEEVGKEMKKCCVERRLIAADLAYAAGEQWRKIKDAL